MGVRGLTSFIARHAEQYLTPYELHDCNLVIDGDNLACNLYKDVTGTYSAFGGDYDDYYRSVIEFFKVLAECNVHAYVLMDGGYEQRKLRTVAKRLRGKIAVIKRINPCGSIALFPQLMKEVFVDAVRAAGVPVMRCVFEADDELATLGRKLNCPVLSYDSDFYIYNVRYIPLVTLTVKAHTKRMKKNATDETGARKLRKNEAKHVEKRTKANRIMSDIQVDNIEKSSLKTGATGTTYKYLDCCMYRIENLITRRSLSKEKLPLFAALLGNDYIGRSAFKNFFKAGMGKVGRSRKMKHQQKRIRVILEWLKQETTEKALERILSRLNKKQRESLNAQVDAATNGYSNEQCHSYDYFLEHYENGFMEFADHSHMQSEELEEYDEGIEQSSEEELDVVDDDEDMDGNENFDDDDDDSDDDNDSSDIEEADENRNDAGEDAEENKPDSELFDKTKLFPAWFLKKLYPANLSRYFVDLMHLKKYINNPQIEHFPFKECNHIALPILIYTFTLLNSVDGEEITPQLDEDGMPQPIQFTYLTRETRVNKLCYKSYAVKERPNYVFQPDEPNPLLFHHIFKNEKSTIDVAKLFDKVKELPKDLQLYFLAIVYWLHKSQYCNLHHLHALLICLTVLRIIDAKIPAERDLKAFHKRFGQIIKKEKQAREQQAQQNTDGTAKADTKAFSLKSLENSIPKSDCYLVQDKLLKHFHMQEIFKKKYDLYSTIVLHSFAQFQAVVYQMNGLSSLLNFPFESPHMGRLYSGVFLYNLYDLLQQRSDVRYYVEHFIFADSPMMFDYYCYLLDWCEPFLPHCKLEQLQQSQKSANKKVLRKQRQAARKQQALTQEIKDPYYDMLENSSECAGEDAEETFYDLNNKFCTLLKVS